MFSLSMKLSLNTTLNAEHGASSGHLARIPSHVPPSMVPETESLHTALAGLELRMWTRLLLSGTHRDRSKCWDGTITPTSNHAILYRGVHPDFLLFCKPYHGGALR